MKKKWIAVLLTLAMTGSMAACVLAVELRAVPGTRMRQKNRQWNCGPVGQMGRYSQSRRRAN